MKTKFLFCALCLVAVRVFGLVSFSVSPNVVSNTYVGYITLQVTGISSGDTVLVQKFLDANTNGVIDAGDILIRQFSMTDGQGGMVIGGVTNINVPGDTDAVAGQITARLNAQTADISEFIASPSAYRLSSPASHFGPITNFFTVTNVSYAQRVTGNVVNNGTNVPNAIVIVFTPPSPSGGGINPVAGVVANNSGAYSIPAAAGTYLILAFKSNFLASAASPSSYFTLNSGATVTTNLTLANATQTISGKIVDAANASVGLPGLLVPVSADASGWFTVTFTDADGNFTVGVHPDQWKFERNESGVAGYGYLVTQGKIRVDTSTGSVAGVTISYPKATALFYGNVKDTLNQPLSGVDLFANDNNDQYESDTRTDVNGYFTIGALCGSPWQVQISNDGNDAFANYDFSQLAFAQNGGTNITCGQTVLANITARLATNHISGFVRDGGGNPLANLQVTAFANIGGTDYQVQIYTDDGGYYSLNVANGDWSVQLCCGCNNCGDGCLSTDYQCTGTQFLTIANNNGTANFTVTLAGQPVLSQPTIVANGQIGFYLSGAIGNNYTIRASTNLTLESSTWPTFLITNLTVSPAFILDSHATNRQRYYRAFLGP